MVRGWLSVGPGLICLPFYYTRLSSIITALSGAIQTCNREIIDARHMRYSSPDDLCQEPPKKLDRCPRRRSPELSCALYRALVGPAPTHVDCISVGGSLSGVAWLKP